MKLKLLVCLILFLTNINMVFSQMNKQSETIKLYNASGNVYEVVEKVYKTESQWREILNDEQYRVTRKHDTERPFKNLYNDNHRRGIYKCIGCGTDLYRSEDKYDSKTGWPSFTKPIAHENVATQDDISLFSRRTEVHCPRCSAHLGHVFEDGPAPTGKRYCMNSASLNFVEIKDQK